MPSMRPSQYAMQQRTDDGPFLRFEREDYIGEFEEDMPSPHQADSGFEPEEDVEDYGMSRVFYSDVPLPDNSPNWHLILEVTSEDLTIYPIYPRIGQVRYGRPKYGNIKSIKITRPVRWPYSHPVHQDDVEGLLSMLPQGFAYFASSGLNMPVLMLNRTRLHSDSWARNFSAAREAYVETASRIGARSVRRSPNILLQQISCFGGFGSSNSMQVVPASSRAVFSTTTLNFFLSVQASAWASSHAVRMPIASR